jgi:hypothetical protein
MRSENELLRKYQSVLADRMTTVRGIAEALASGTLGELTPEQSHAVAMLERSLRRLGSDLVDLTQALEGRPDPDEVTALVRSALAPLTGELGDREITLETHLPSFQIRVRTGGAAASEALQLLGRCLIRSTSRGGTLQFEAALSGDNVVIEAASTQQASPAPPPIDRDVRIGTVRKLLATFGGNLWIERGSSGCGVRVTLPVAHH